MQTTRTSLVTALLALSVCVSAASAGALMGPPIAVLEEGQWSLGGEFAHEQADMEAFGISVESVDDFSTFYAQPFTLKDFETNMFFGTLAYGICDNWNVFVRAGAADAQDDVILHPATEDFAEDRIGFDGDYGFAWGVGTRATFCRSGPWSFGGLLQVTWFDPGDGDFQLGDPADPLFGAVIGDIGIDYWQTQVALTVAYQVDTWTLWAGPFLQFVDGDLELDGQLVLDNVVSGNITSDADIDESSQVGGHAGGVWRLAEQWSLSVEGQFTSDSWLVGIGANFIPESFGP